MMKSIEKLREWSRLGPMACQDLLDIADEIEREIAERYMELPLDTNGVPIRTGDIIEFGKKGERLEVTHFGWTEHGDPTIAYRRPNGTLDCSCIGTECRHVKPRTLEDVLQDAGVSVAAIEDVAAEIRELMEVDA